ANPIPPMAHPEENTDKNTFYYLPPMFHKKSDTLSSTRQVLLPPQSSVYSVMGSTPLLLPKSSIEPLSANKRSKELEHPASKKIKLSSTPSLSSPVTMHPRFNAPLPSLTAATPANSIPMRYKPGLVPCPSLLRPHCLARERLCKWLPAGGKACNHTSLSPETQNINVSDEQLDHILEVIGSSWA
ncbi:hypothetical protein DFJ58DRAFT_647438, partial [Suillus subalutaceus]|uniref:uncharacterized protein n=1 Tax=Suillus subalutaceus TaxID=48586 RepID=UPI001B87ECBA